MSIATERDAEVRRLSALSKHELARLWRDGPGKGWVWSATPPERWSKDELVNELLVAFDSRTVTS